MNDWLFFSLLILALLLNRVFVMNNFDHRKFGKFWDSIKLKLSPKRRLITTSILLIAAFAICTNPSKRDFDDFIQTEITFAPEHQKIITGRSRNYLVFSIYEFKVIDKWEEDDRQVKQAGSYIAYFSNFHSQ